MKILKQAQTLPPTLQGNTTVSGVKAVIMHMITFLLLTSKILFLCFSYIQIFTGMFTLPDDASLLLVVVVPFRDSKPFFIYKHLFSHFF